MNEREQAFYADVSRPRELSRDAQLYRAYLHEEARLREQGATIHHVVLDHGLQARIPEVAPGAESRPAGQ